VFTSIRTTFPGFELSCRHKLNIVTGNEHTAVFPAASVAVHVTVVVPTGNIEPDGGTHATVTPGQLSLTAGVAKFTTPALENGHVAWATTLTVPGHPFVNVGGIGSTVVVAVPVLLPGAGSGIELAAVAELLITVPCTVPALTLTTIWNVAVSPFATDAFENTTFPVPPTAGALVLQPVPLVTVADTNVVFAGTASVTVVVTAEPGPLLVKLIV
jgi:hypothetical protein